MNRNYTNLLRISEILVYFAYVCFALGVIAFAVSLLEKSVFIGLVAVICSFFAGLLCFAFGELIHLFINIEYNTRSEADKLNPFLKPRKDNTILNSERNSNGMFGG